MIEAATAFSQERILQARGDSDRFTSILKEYQAAPGVTRERLHLETLEQVLSKVDKVIINEGTRNNILPLLPLRSSDGVSQPQASSQPSAPSQPQTTAPSPTPTPSQAASQPKPGGR